MMFKSKFVFAVSFVALFAVGSAWAADSAADPDAGIAGVSYVDRLLDAKEDVSNKANQVTGNMKKEQMYPTVALTESLISGANQDMSDLIGEVADGKTVVDMITDKQDELGSTNVTTTGETGVVKTVVGNDGQLTVTKSAVVADDIAASAVTTEKINAKAVTVAKTTGIYGYIPTKSDGTGSAQIWVE